MRPEDFRRSTGLLAWIGVESDPFYEALKRHEGGDAVQAVMEATHQHLDVVTALREILDYTEAKDFLWEHALAHPGKFGVMLEMTAGRVETLRWLASQCPNEWAFAGMMRHAIDDPASWEAKLANPRFAQRPGSDQPEPGWRRPPPEIPPRPSVAYSVDFRRVPWENVPSTVWEAWRDRHSGQEPNRTNPRHLAEAQRLMFEGVRATAEDRRKRLRESQQRARQPLTQEDKHIEARVRKGIRWSENDLRIDIGSDFYELTLVAPDFADVLIDIAKDFQSPSERQKWDRVRRRIETPKGIHDDAGDYLAEMFSTFATRDYRDHCLAGDGLHGDEPMEVKGALLGANFDWDSADQTSSIRVDDMEHRISDGKIPASMVVGEFHSEKYAREFIMKFISENPNIDTLYKELPFEWQRDFDLLWCTGRKTEILRSYFENLRHKYGSSMEENFFDFLSSCKVRVVGIDTGLADFEHPRSRGNNWPLRVRKMHGVTDHVFRHDVVRTGPVLVNPGSAHARAGDAGLTPTLEQLFDVPAIKVRSSNFKNKNIDPSKPRVQRPTKQYRNAFWQPSGQGGRGQNPSPPKA
jgi:hypothetical protein